MGNKIARTTQASATEYYLHDLPSTYNLVLTDVLGRGRFLKSIRCKHDEGLVLVKVYFKRGEPVSLKAYEKRLAEIRDIFQSLQHPHVWPFQLWQETDKAAYLLRQYFFSNLHDRLSTRPFLSLIEKKWLAFQLLFAVEQCHSKGVCHGDIKCENVLVTSWNWLYLADFASFKPTYIPDDDPSDFSFFFDTGGRRRCYLAPERFYEHGGESQVAQDNALRTSMDIFSLGCVIAELFLEGQPLFELSQLLAYRRGQYDPNQYLEKIQDSGIRRMILHMIQLDPESRLSATSYLQTFASIIFPSYFSPFLHKFFSCIIPLDSDSRVAVTHGAFLKIHEQMKIGQLNEDISSNSSTSNEPVLQIIGGSENLNLMTDFMKVENYTEKVAVTNPKQLLGDITSLLEDEQRGRNLYTVGKNEFTAYSSDVSEKHTHCLSKGIFAPQPSSDSSRLKNKQASNIRTILKSDLDSIADGYDSQTDTYAFPCFTGTDHEVSCEGMVLITSLLCSCIRNVKQPQLRRAALLLLKTSSLYIDDENRLQHVLPYVIERLSDPTAIVRCAALETLCDILPLVQDFPPSDAMIFPEYILPMLSMLPDDPEESVRICYASNIYKLALTAYRFLIHSQNIGESGSLVKSHLGPVQSHATETQRKKNGQKGDNQLLQLRKSIAEIVQELVMGQKQTPNIRRALLQNIGHLCYFFGQRQCNDFLLPILPAFLNDRDEQLRAVFYEQIVFVCYFIGKISVEEYLLPYIEQALSDEMETVIVNALECLSMLCRSGFLRKRVLLAMIEKVFPLLGYPIQWVRRSAVTFIVASSKSLGSVDSRVYLTPVLRSFVCREPPVFFCSETDLLSCLKPPVSKLNFYQGLENARGSAMLERQRKIWYDSSTGPTQWGSLEHSRKAAEVRFNNNSDKKESSMQAGLCTNNALSNTPFSIIEGASKVRPGGSSQYLSNSMSIRDSISSDKLQFSGLISPYVNSGNNTLYDGTGEGIPLYSVCIDKQATEVSAGSDSSLHWLEPGNRPLEFSGAHLPKLVSGSFVNIANDNRQAKKAVHDSEGRENDQSLHFSSKFQDITINESIKGGLSKTGNDASQPDFTGLPSFSGASSVPDAGWKPRGVLVAHLQEHRSAVNDLAISNDHTFFISASDDFTVKIWDTRKLEKDISFRSRLTYDLEGSRALCTIMLQGTAQVVIGASDGTLHLFSIDISRRIGNAIEKYAISGVRKKEIGEGSIASLVNCSKADSAVSQTIVFSTLRCGIHLWDTRMNSESWTFRAAPEDGYISSLVMGPCGNWFVSGSSRGMLTLWDLRFLVPVNSWHLPLVCPVEKMCLLIPSSNSISAASRPLVYVAAGQNETSLWNAENGSCHKVFRMLSSDSEAGTSNVSRAVAQTRSKQNSKLGPKWNAKSKYRTDELSEPTSRLHGARSLLPLPGGDLLFGATDLRIRYWDHASPDRSCCICGPSMKGFKNDEYYDIRSEYGVQVVQEKKKSHAAPELTQKALVAMAATDSAGCHRDSVVSLASVKLNQRLLISSSRDGAIKVWK